MARDLSPFVKCIGVFREAIRVVVPVISIRESSSLTMEGFPKAKKLKEDIDSDKRIKESSLIQNSVKSLDPCHCEVTTQAPSDSVIKPELEGDQTVPNEGPPPSISDKLLAIEERLCAQLLEIKFPSPVTHIYNPLSYARQTHQSFVRRFGNSRKKILFVGMNPGPFGMAQNGVRIHTRLHTHTHHTHTHTHNHMYSCVSVHYGRSAETI